MKDYLPIIERLFYAIAFFFLGWFAKSSTYKPTYLKNDVEVIYSRDTIREVLTKEKEQIIYKYINKVDSFKYVIKDTIFILPDSTKSLIKDTIIAIQDTTINLLQLETRFLNNELDTCYKNNLVIAKENIDLQKQVKKDHKNKAILGGVGVILAGVLSYFLF